MATLARANRRSTGPAEPAALTASTGFLLARIGGESRRLWTQALASVGLRPSHFGVMMTLGVVGSASQRDLGRSIGVDPRNLVAIVDTLEHRGLVERAPNRTDRRRYSVQLTDAGRNALAELRAAGDAAEAHLLSGLTATERRALHDLLLKLLPVVAEKPPAE